LKRGFILTTLLSFCSMLIRALNLFSRSAVPLPAASVDLAWSNLALHCAEDPLPALKELRRVLKVGGLFMFSCYGPDTLKELKSAFETGLGNIQ